MTAEMTRGKFQTLGIVFVVAVYGLAGTASGQSSWSQRAKEVAAARLAAHYDAGAGDRAADRSASDMGSMFRLATAFEPPSFRLVAGPETAPASEAAVLETREAVSESSPATGETACEIQRGPLPGFFETIVRDLKEAPETLWHDTKATYGNPWNLAFLIGAGGASLAVRYGGADDCIEDHYDKHHTFGQSERDTFDALTNPATAFAVAGALYVAGQAMQEVKTYEVGKRAFSALIITDLSTLLLKLAACTESPNGTNLGWPSGHVSSSMALATVLNDAYGPVVGVPMFAITALSGIERLDSREHHFSDVIFGAALGWVVGQTVMNEHRPEVFGGELVPYLDPHRAVAGVAWIKCLGN
ncbi:MAG TPA: phosphatase PAP2 family protein [Phycisphaerae bacterium]|jgi:membrane-associated phospholipid phosphatase|nr:phosphatase PAP2 family protein [Phycisphaerae bacterium]HOJ54459.1 phosphatase PAP2 family protein [Phycisphaerae bacterium]HOL26226.1 phosphatase PAP2 family protein [Phycisphaerae bacterium]HPP20751.1 phosphatase PAP2 family protein [Phycisphaerae bacterium]HPU34351.1 phosphatase PAP2 family protein [Phycisphaerae bacterium]